MYLYFTIHLPTALVTHAEQKKNFSTGLFVLVILCAERTVHKTKVSNNNNSAETKPKNGNKR